MNLSGAALGKLGLDEEVREAVDRARAITAQNARRRAERALAGDLRRHDLDEVASRIAGLEAIEKAENQLFEDAERWRTRLIEEGSTACAEFPGGAEEPLPQLIAQARREKSTGKPPGAARALFRHVTNVLKAQAKPAAPAVDPDDEPDEDPGGDD